MTKNGDGTFELHVVVPVASAASGTGGDQLELQSEGFAGIFFREKTVKSERLLESWENTRRALGVMIAGSKQDEATGMRLEELEVSLTVSGEGNIAFVAAKAEASIVLKFKRSGAGTAGG